jgi:hypothetical protein
MEHQDGTNETQGRNELAQLPRRSQWIAWGVSLPLVMLGAPLLLHLPMSGPYISAVRTACSVYLLLLTIATLVWLTLAIRRHWTIVGRRWGGRIFVLGTYALCVPFVYIPLAYLLTGGIGNNQFAIAMTGGAFGISVALFGVGLLVVLVEIGMDPTIHLH